MPPHGYKEVTLGQYLGKLREQAAQMEPGPFKDLVLKHARAVQAVLDRQVPSTSTQMSEKEAVKATNDVLAQFRLK